MGRDDAYLILFCVTLFTGLRASTMEYLLAPFAKMRGLTKRKDITRFSEQAWMLVYYVVFWPAGAVGSSLRPSTDRPLTRYSICTSSRPTT